MALRLEIISVHREKLGERAVKEFGRDGGTIGRSLGNDWVLPDALRYVSSRHASIDLRSGSYYLVDTSTNGVYVNDAEQPVGRGHPQRLFHGDRLRIGDYEMLVSIDDGDDSADVFDGGHVDPVELAQRVQSPEPTHGDLIDPFEITGVGIEEILTEDEDGMATTAQLEVLELSLEDETPPAPAARRNEPQARTGLTHEPPGAPGGAARGNPGTSPVGSRATAGRPSTSASAAGAAGAAAGLAAASRPAGTAASATSPSGSPSAAAKPAPAAKASSTDTSSAADDPAQAALEAFFRGAGLPLGAAGEQDAELTLHRAGQLVRELILGIMESLQTRAQQKSLLRLPNTTIQRQANNPLKFSAGIDEALNNLFFRQSPEYLSAVEAVREALRDIKQHQQLLLNALPTAITDYVGRLDPEELEQKFSSGKRGALLGAAQKLRYWDLYRDLYQVVANHTPGQLPPQFVEELSRVYEQESTRLAVHDTSAKQAG